MSKTRVNLSDKVYNLIIEDIFVGKLKQGTKIAEEKLGQMYNVSRTPIREAVRKLSTQGLLRCEPRSHIAIVKITKEEIQQVLAMESILAAFTCRNLNVECLKAHEETIKAEITNRRRALEEKNIYATLKADLAFLDLFFASSSNFSINTIFSFIIKPKLIMMAPEITNLDELTAYVDKKEQLAKYLENGEFEKAALLCEKFFN